MAVHSSIVAWEIPGTGKPGGYCPWGHKRVGDNLVTKQQQQYKYYIYIHTPHTNSIDYIPNDYQKLWQKTAFIYNIIQIYFYTENVLFYT